jgi:uncharacterized protein
MHPDAQRLVEALELRPHPEGGFYRETFRAALSLPRVFGEETRAASTAIYFLLPAGVFSALHRVRSDELWHHYDGDPVELHTIDEAGSYKLLRLGKDLAAGEEPQRVVPAGVWQAAVPRGPRFALCGCTVAPGFDFADFEMPPRAALLARLPAHRELITRLTRE